MGRGRACVVREIAFVAGVALVGRDGHLDASFVQTTRQGVLVVPKFIASTWHAVRAMHHHRNVVRQEGLHAFHGLIAANNHDIDVMASTEGNRGFNLRGGIRANERRGLFVEHRKQRIESSIGSDGRVSLPSGGPTPRISNQSVEFFKALRALGKTNPRPVEEQPRSRLNGHIFPGPTIEAHGRAPTCHQATTWGHHPGQYTVGSGDRNQITVRIDGQQRAGFGRDAAQLVVIQSDFNRTGFVQTKLGVDQDHPRIHVGTLAVDDLIPRLQHGIARPNLSDQSVFDAHKSRLNWIRIGHGMDGASGQDDRTILIGGWYLSALAPSRRRNHQSQYSNNVMTHSWAP